MQQKRNRRLDRTINDDLSLFEFLIVEYANAPYTELTEDARDLKYKLHAMLGRNGWRQTSSEIQDLSAKLNKLLDQMDKKETKIMGTININGRTYHGNSVSVVNGTVYIDNVKQDDKEKLSGVVEIRIVEGTVQNIHSDASITAKDIQGNATAGGSVNCNNVGGNAIAGGSVHCGDVKGSVNAGGSVSTKKTWC